MTTENNHTPGGSKSVKVGVGDIYDKTTISMHVAASSFPSTGIMRLSYAIWFSKGSELASGQKLVTIVMGEQVRVFLDSGVWQYVDSTRTRWFPIGTLKPSTEAWHVFSFNVDLATSTWDSILVDGVNVDSTLKGKAFYGRTKSATWGQVRAFSTFIDQSYQVNKSVYTAGSGAVYYYLDDYKIERVTVPTTSLTATVSTTPPTTTSLSSSASSSTTASSTGSSAPTGIRNAITITQAGGSSGCVVRGFRTDQHDQLLKHLYEMTDTHFRVIEHLMTTRP